MKYLSRDAVCAAGCARMQRWGCCSSCPLLCPRLCLLFPRSTQRSLGSVCIPSSCGFLGCLSPCAFPTESAQAVPHPSQLPAGPWGCRGAVGVPCPPVELLEEPTPRCPGKRLRDAPASLQRCRGEPGANLPLAQSPAQPHGRRLQQQIPSPSVTSSH